MTSSNRAISHAPRISPAPRIGRRTGFMERLHVENLDVKPETHGPFPGMMAAEVEPPLVSTFSVATTRGGTETVRADQIWVSEGAVWFSRGGELAAVYNMAHFNWATEIKADDK